MVLFVLKGGGMFAEISTIRNNKNRKNFKLGRDEKLTCLLALTSSGGARGGKGGQMPPPNYFLPPHFAPPQKNVLVTESD